MKGERIEQERSKAEEQREGRTHTGWRISSRATDMCEHENGNKVLNDNCGTWLHLDANQQQQTHT